MRRRRAWRAARSALFILALCNAAEHAVAEASGNGLSAAQTRDLHELGFAVVPDPLPPGFSISSVTVDKRRHRYTIAYERRKDGALMTFEGEGKGSGERKRGGFLGTLSDTFDKYGAHKDQAATAQLPRTVGSEDTTPAIEAERTDVVSDSPLVGPIHFTDDGACFSGSPDATKAAITEAHFTVSACNLRAPEPMIRAYKSLVKI